MKKAWGSSRSNVLLAIVVMSILGGVGYAQWQIRSSPRYQAEQYLKRSDIASTVDSAVNAVKEGKIFVLEQLLAVGVDFGASATTGVTPLLAALGQDQPQVFDFVLPLESVSRTLNTPDPAGKTPLALMLEARDFGRAERLLQQGASVDTTLDGKTPALITACRNRDGVLLDFLVSHGADLNVADASGETALDIAWQRNDGALRAKLFDAGAAPSEAKKAAWLASALAGRDLDLVDEMAGRGLVQGPFTAEGQPLTIQALRQGDALLLDFALRHGGKPEDQAAGAGAGAGGEDALALAARSGRWDLLAPLLEAGRPSQETLDGLLTLLLDQGDALIVKTLAERGWLLSDAARDRNLRTALEGGRFEAAQALFRQGASAKGLLWQVLPSGQEEWVSLLLERGASPDETREDGVKAIDHAVTHGWKSIQRTLLEAGADPNAHREGEAWIAIALREGDLETAGALLDRGAVVKEVVDRDGHSLVGWAIARRDAHLLERLLALGCDPSVIEPAPAAKEFRELFDSRTFRYHLESDSRIRPMHLAAAQRDLAMARALAKAGAKPGNATKKYLWPVNIAAWYGDVPLQQLFLGRDPSPEAQTRKLIVDLGKQRVTVFENGASTLSSRISTGKSGYRTPSGTFVITNKYRHWVSTIYHAQMPYFMRLSCAAFGLHQGAVPNYPASHGCIRVPAGTASKLFAMCEVGDIVEIVQ